MRVHLLFVVVLLLVMPGIGGVWSGEASAQPVSGKLPPLPIDDDDDEVGLELDGVEGETDPDVEPDLGVKTDLEEEPKAEATKAADEPVDVESTRKQILSDFPDLPIDDPRVGMDRSGTSRPIVCAPEHYVPAMATMKRRVDRLLDTDKLKGARVGVLAVAYPEGTILYERDPHGLYNPASVSKVFTAATALQELGESARFKTWVSVDKGDCPTLYLQGEGDPGLDEKDLQALARKVKESGIQCVRRVVYTERPFDGKTLPPAYEQKKTDAAYRSRIGAVGIGRGAFALRVIPGKRSGDPARIELFPSCSGFVVDNKAVTVNPSKEEPPRLRANVSDYRGQTVVHVGGEISVKREGGKTISLALPNPSRFAAWYLQDRLADVGIKVSKGSPRDRDVPETVTEVASVTSAPLSQDVKEMQEWSRNYIAEQLVKLLSIGECKPYTFECGIKRLLRVLPMFHVPSSCVQFKNGSGLYDANRISPWWTVRALLEIANRGKIADSFLGAFARGCKTGTLRNRMKRVGRPVLAKTGTLDGVSALAGYIMRKSGGYIVFAIYFNDSPTSASNSRQIQDKMVETFSLFDSQ